MHSNVAGGCVEVNEKLGFTSVDGFDGFAVIVVSGAAVSRVMVLSVLVDAVFVLPAASCALPDWIVAMTVPSVVSGTDTSHDVPGTIGVMVAVPRDAVPLKLKSVASKPVTISENTTVTWTGEYFVGSAWVAAWLTVTLGLVLSIVICFVEEPVLVAASVCDAFAV